MLYYLASYRSTLGERESEESESEEASNFEPFAKRPCSTIIGHHASKFCRNEIKTKDYKSIQQHIFISFSFSGKKWLVSPMLDVIFVGNFPQSPLNKVGKNSDPRSK